MKYKFAVWPKSIGMESLDLMKFLVLKRFIKIQWWNIDSIQKNSYNKQIIISATFNLMWIEFLSHHLILF